ncbi:Ring canal kelch [Nymphon striatum]|nr:Ring canal kelch [Nymphon striatum]
MCHACTNVWIRDLGNYRYFAEKMGKCPTQYGKKDPSETFRENHYLNKININGFRFESVEKIFDYFYSGAIIINQNELKDIIRLAKLFQLDSVLDKVFNYIKDNLNIENVLCIRDLWMVCDHMENVEYCDKFIENHFEEISTSPKFSEIEFNYLKKLLKSDDLVVKDEKRIFEIVVEWANVDIQRRQQHVQQLMEDVRFPLMPYEYLHQIAVHEINSKYKIINEKELNENIICIGGSKDEQNNLNSIDFCSDFGRFWNKFDEINPGRSCFASCTYENSIIMIGGFGAKRLCTKYDPKNKTFSELEPLPEDRFQHIATIINSELMICGGVATKKSVISLNLSEQNRKWINRKSSLESRHGSTGCSVNDKFYVFGGLKSNSCEYYCPQEDSWKPLTKMKEERFFAGSCYDNNKFIYVVGGGDVTNAICLTSMERFDVEIGQWSTLNCSIGVGRWGLSLTIFKNQIIIIGGRDKCSQIGNLKEARAHHCTVNLKF